MKDPHDLTQWQPGDRFAYRSDNTPFRLHTIKGDVYIQPGTYGRFIMTSEGWRVDDDR